jgi:hypothetical protein
MVTETETFEFPDLALSDSCLGGCMYSEVYKRKVDIWDRLLARILDVAACIKGRDDQLRRTTRELCGPGSSVGIATGYGLDGLRIESRWGKYFPHLSRPTMGPTLSPVQWVPGLSGGRKRPGCDADPSPLLVSRSKNRVGLYLYSP